MSAPDSGSEQQPEALVSGQPPLLDLLRAWLPGQRWFRSEAALVQVSESWPHDEVAAGVRIETFILDAAGTRYQVPLAFRAAGTLPDTSGEVESQPGPGFIGHVTGPDGVEKVGDAVHDDAYLAALWHDFTWVEDVPPLPTGVRVLGGEMSNTSVIAEGEVPLILKVFRVLADGENPDITIQRALRGQSAVPRIAGWLNRGETSLAIASEFIADAADAWRHGLKLAQAGAEWDMHGLGVTTAHMHAGLREAFGTFDPDPDGLRAHLIERLDWAAGMVPQIRDGYDLIVQRLTALDLPAVPRQRIHGDFHLGQVLASPSRGWVILDFEGEPMRPLAQRLAPDYAFRDLAGMLRSLDYALWHVGLDGTAPRSWLHSAHDDFLAGYVAGGGADPGQYPDLLTALELDKALYEAVYEKANRPDWLHIPLAGIALLVPGMDQFVGR